MARSRKSRTKKAIVIRKRSLGIGIGIVALFAIIAGIVLVAQTGSTKAKSEASSGSGAAHIAVDRE